MIPYLILLFTVVPIAYVGRRYSSKGMQLLSLATIVLLLTLFAGLRNYTVGTDTGTYVRHFISVSSFSDIWRTTEIGSNTLMVLAKAISSNYASFLTIIALVIVSCYVSTIVRLTKRYETAVFLFITLGFYTFFLNGAKQGIAAAICFLAIPWLLDRKPIQYFLLTGLAVSFHHTAIIALPLYFIAGPRVGLRQISLVVVGAILTSLFLLTFVSLAAVLIKEQYAYYAIQGDGGGRVTSVFLVCQGILFYFLRPDIYKYDSRYNRLLNIYIVGLIPVIASAASNLDPSTILRLHLYFSSMAILIWPMIFSSWKDSPKRMLISLAFVSFCLVYYVLTTTSFSHLVPYVMNKSIFS